MQVPAPKDVPSFGAGFLRAHGAALLVAVLTACATERPGAGGPPPAAKPAPAARRAPTPGETAGSAGAGAERAAGAPLARSLEDAEDSETIAPQREQFPFHEPLPGSETVARSPASAAANLSPAQCRNELRRRKIETRRAPGPASGVATPVRLAGTLGGVRFVAPGGKSVYGTFDCRLVLALDAFSRILKEHAVVEVHVDNAYRPRARLPGRRGKRSQHAYGLAADILGMKLEDGRSIVVERDWRGALGAPSCGPDANPENPTEETIVLRNVLCQAAREGVFHHLLTPNHDAAHRDHLHLDIQRGARSLLLR